MGLPEFAGGPRRISGFAGYVYHRQCFFHLYYFSNLSLSLSLTHTHTHTHIVYVITCRGSQPIITSTTVEVVVPRALVAEIYGENGECLKQILQVRPLHLTIDDANCLVSICLFICG